MSQHSFDNKRVDPQSLPLTKTKGIVMFWAKPELGSSQISLSFYLFFLVPLFPPTWYSGRWVRTRDSKDRKVTTVPQCLKTEVETCIYGQCGQPPCLPCPVLCCSLSLSVVQKQSPTFASPNRSCSFLAWGLCTCYSLCQECFSWVPLRLQISTHPSV